MVCVREGGVGEGGVCAKGAWVGQNAGSKRAEQRLRRLDDASSV